MSQPALFPPSKPSVQGSTKSTCLSTPPRLCDEGRVGLGVGGGVRGETTPCLSLTTEKLENKNKMRVAFKTQQV